MQEINVEKFPLTRFTGPMVLRVFLYNGASNGDALQCKRGLVQFAASLHLECREAPDGAIDLQGPAPMQDPSPELRRRIAAWLTDLDMTSFVVFQRTLRVCGFQIHILDGRNP